MKCMLKIGDLGLARALNSIGAANTVCGTPGYLAPELLVQRSQDERGDLWSVGIIVFEMLVSIRAVDLDRISIDRESPIEHHQVRSWNPELSEAGVDLIVQLLQPDPARRLTLDDLRHHAFMRPPAEDAPGPGYAAVASNGYARVPSA